MDTLIKIFNRKMLSIALLGIASGVPLGVVLSVFQAWLTKSGLDLKTIGLMALVQMPYTWKFLWSPLMDRFAPPFLGRRRGWMLVSQGVMIAAIFMMGQFDPNENLSIIIYLATLISFAGASHDIVIDAYRREVLADDELGMGSAVATNSYLIGFRYLAVVLGLALADFLPWSQVFMVLSGLIGLGIIGTFIALNPPMTIEAPKNIKEALIFPFLDFLKRRGAIEVLLFILLYKVGDNLASNLVTPFYLKMGYALTEISLVGKMVGFWATFAGSFIGGFFLIKYNIRHCLLIFGVLQAVSTLSFLLLNNNIPDLWMLGGVVAFENITSGMGTAAFAAFMLKSCSRTFSATQFALLTSFMGIPRSIIPAFAGYIAEPLGWSMFFIISTLIAIPGLLMIIFRAKKWEMP